MTQTPTRVTFRGLSHSDALEADVLERVEWLERFYRPVTTCHVTVELPHGHRQSGRHFHVCIELTVPGRAPVVITQEPTSHGNLTDVEEDAPHKKDEIDGAHRYARVAIREAFDVARRRLEDLAREQRGDVKTHPRVARRDQTQKRQS